jgi:cadmium resistance protein CadD (predicted permease)
VAGITNIVSIVAVFALGEAILTLGVLRIGQHQRIRDVATRVGVFAAPVLYCVIGLVVLFRAGTV